MVAYPSTHHHHHHHHQFVVRICVRVLIRGIKGREEGIPGEDTQMVIEFIIIWCKHYLPAYHHPLLIPSHCLLLFPSFPSPPPPPASLLTSYAFSSLLHILSPLFHFQLISPFSCLPFRLPDFRIYFSFRFDQS